MALGHSFLEAFLHPIAFASSLTTATPLLGLRRALVPEAVRRILQREKGWRILPAWYGTYFMVAVLDRIVDWVVRTNNSLPVAPTLSPAAALGVRDVDLYDGTSEPWVTYVCEPWENRLLLEGPRPPLKLDDIKPLPTRITSQLTSFEIPTMIFAALLDLLADDIAKAQQEYKDATRRRKPQQPQWDERPWTPRAPTSLLRCLRDAQGGRWTAGPDPLAFGLVCRSWAQIYRRWNLRELQLEGDEADLLSHLRANAFAAESVRRLTILGGVRPAVEWHNEENTTLRGPQTYASEKMGTRARRRAFTGLSILDGIADLPNLEAVVLKIWLGPSILETRRFCKHVSRMKVIRHLFVNIHEPSCPRSIAAVLAALGTLTQLSGLMLTANLKHVIFPVHIIPRFHLKFLKITYATLSDADLAWLASSSADTLVELMLFLVRGISPEGFDATMSLIGPNLQWLQVELPRGRDEVGPTLTFDDGLRHLGPNLQLLAIGGPAFSGNVLTTIIPSAKASLRHVAVGLCQDELPKSTIASFLRGARCLKEPGRITITLGT